MSYTLQTPMDDIEGTWGTRRFDEYSCWYDTRTNTANTVIAVDNNTSAMTSDFNSLRGTFEEDDTTYTTTLADLKSAINNVRIEVDNVDVNTDELESLIATSNTNTAAANTSLGTVGATLTSIDGHVDGLESLLTTGNTNTANTAAAIATQTTNLEGTDSRTLSDIYTQLDALNTAITSLSEKVDTANTHLAQIETNTTPSA